LASWEVGLAVATGLAVGALVGRWSGARKARRAVEEQRRAQTQRDTLQAERERAMHEARRLLAQREAALEERARGMDRQDTGLREAEGARAERERELSAREQVLAERLRAAEQTADQAKKDAAALIAQATTRLSEAARLPQEQARALLLEQLDRDLAAEKARRILRAEEEASAEAAKRAREVVLTAVQRVAVEHVVSSTVLSVPLPNDEMKGRIIGREGRNVRALEAATGCDVMVDEVPGQVLVSSFDPLRRELARTALVTLMQDGRIQPARVEEVVAEARARLDERMAEEGRKALHEAEVGEAHPDVVLALGRLAFRTSYSQNVLRHSIEAAHVAGAMAAELGLDARLARRAALLHDLGKVLPPADQGGHADAGALLLKRAGEHPSVVAAAETHHDDLRRGDPYAVLAQVADAVSAARPGARREPVGQYAKRLEDLEKIAGRFEGVDDVYALQAGRELRVIVDAEKVTDAMAPLLAHDIARAVEAEVTYAGEVKVTVVREVRAIHVAR
jgi:ribonuclease Y